MQPFALRFELASEIILGRRLHLDGVLAALIYERTGDLERAHEALPLRQERAPDGQWVWTASSALVEGPTPIVQSTVVRTMRPEFDLTPDTIRPTRGRYPRVDVQRGAYQNAMSIFQAYEARAVWFTGFGDIETIQHLVADLPAIGTKRHHGRGQIAGFEIVAIEHEAAGIAYADGTPARAMPTAVWQARASNADAEMAIESFRPPYFNGPRATCVVPSHLVCNLEQIEEFVAL